MRLETTGIDGLQVVSFDRHSDERGFFQRTFDGDAFQAQGLANCSLQCSVSWNPKQGTLRGMHLQRIPHGETKLVRCLQGRIFDVAVDLRPGSATLGQWKGFELSAENGRALYIPQGFAHGFLTLDAAALVHYQMAEPFEPSASFGIRWDDPQLAIAWPEQPKVVGVKDQLLPYLPDRLHWPKLLQPT
jgi:dTDP-4-dehydrorhamnose 3,5-epimerase